jgi:hypothetical protein
MAIPDPGSAVTGWAIGKALDNLVQWAELAVHCNTKCAALAETLRAQLRSIAYDLDELTQAEAFAQVRGLYDTLCEHLEEAQYVMLRCRQTSNWDIVTRIRMSKRIHAVQSKLRGIASENTMIAVCAALQQDRAIRAQRERDATAAEERARLLQLKWHDYPPLRDERGAVQRAASVRDPRQQTISEPRRPCAAAVRRAAKAPHAWHTWHGGPRQDDRGGGCVQAISLPVPAALLPDGR